MAYRVADACEHAELMAKPEIGEAIPAARVPTMRFGWRRYHWRFEPEAEVAAKQAATRCAISDSESG
jgi:hypothetical protein